MTKAGRLANETVVGSVMAGNVVRVLVGRAEKREVVERSAWSGLW